MKSRLISLWESLRTGFWFVPTLMAAASVALAFGTVKLDSNAIGKKVANSVGLSGRAAPTGRARCFRPWRAP